MLFLMFMLTLTPIGSFKFFLSCIIFYDCCSIAIVIVIVEQLQNN